MANEETRAGPKVPDAAAQEFSEGKKSDPWQEGPDPWSGGKTMSQSQSSSATPPQPSWEEFQKFFEWWARNSLEAESEGFDSKAHRNSPAFGKGKGKGGQKKAASAWKSSASKHRRAEHEHELGDRARRFGGHGDSGEPDRSKDLRGHRARTGHTQQDPDPPRRPNGDRPPGGPASDPGARNSGGHDKEGPKRTRRAFDPPGSDPPDDDDNGSSHGSDDWEDDSQDLPSAATSESVRTSEVKSLLMKRWKENERPKSSLGSVKIEDFAGDRGRYRSWRRVVRAQQQLYQLADPELAMLIYLSCKREARDVLDQMTIEEMVRPEGLAKVWQLLDEAYHETSEYFERVESEFASYRRAPTQSIASFLSQIKRLKADYLREDPDTKFSDRAWAQRVLVRASLSKRERLDVFFSAGGVYASKEIERALRHRCQRVHEEEKRLPSMYKKGPRSFASRSTASMTTSSNSSTTSSARFKRKGFSKGHGAHVAGQDDEPEVLPSDEEEEDLEQEPGAYEAYVQDRDRDEVLEDGPEDECEEDEESEAEDSITHEELKEAWAAGWRAKDQIAEKKRFRNFKKTGQRSSQQPTGVGNDPRKQSTTCSSCGNRGHWKGDPECPKVKAGVDKPFQPKQKVKNHVNYVGTPSSLPVISEVQSTEASSLHQVNFTFMVGDGDGGNRVPQPKQPARKEAKRGRFCPQCGFRVKLEDKFCSDCGHSLGAPSSSSVPSANPASKRSSLLLDYASEAEEESSESSNETSDDSFQRVDEGPFYVVPLEAARAAALQIDRKPMKAGKLQYVEVDAQSFLTWIRRRRRCCSISWSRKRSRLVMNDDAGIEKGIVIHLPGQILQCPTQCLSPGSISGHLQMIYQRQWKPRRRKFSSELFMIFESVEGDFVLQMVQQRRLSLRDLVRTHGRIWGGPTTNGVSLHAAFVVTSRMSWFGMFDMGPTSHSMRCLSRIPLNQRCFHRVAFWPLPIRVARLQLEVLSGTNASRLNWRSLAWLGTKSKNPSGSNLVLATPSCPSMLVCTRSASMVSIHGFVWVWWKLMQQIVQVWLAQLIWVVGMWLSILVRGSCMLWEWLGRCCWLRQGILVSTCWSMAIWISLRVMSLWELSLRSWRALPMPLLFLLQASTMWRILSCRLRAMHLGCVLRMKICLRRRIHRFGSWCRTWRLCKLLRLKWQLVAGRVRRPLKTMKRLIFQPLLMNAVVFNLRPRRVLRHLRWNRGVMKTLRFGWSLEKLQPSARARRGEFADICAKCMRPLDHRSHRSSGPWVHRLSSDQKGPTKS